MQFSDSKRLLTKATLKCKLRCYFIHSNKDYMYFICLYMWECVSHLNRNDQECLKMGISYSMYRRAGIFFKYVDLHEMIFCVSVSI